MIDNYEQAMELVTSMRAHLPFPVRPTAAFVRAMRGSGAQIAPGQSLQVEAVHYVGDDAGIVCTILPPENPVGISVSLTQVLVDDDHPLVDEIRAYQTERKRRLGQASRRPKPKKRARKPSRPKAKSRKKRKRR